MEKNSQTKSVFTISGRHRFVACVIVVILVSCAAFAYLASCYKVSILLPLHPESRKLKLVNGC